MSHFQIELSFPDNCFNPFFNYHEGKYKRAFNWKVFSNASKAIQKKLIAEAGVSEELGFYKSIQRSITTQEVQDIKKPAFNFICDPKLYVVIYNEVCFKLTINFLLMGVCYN